MISSGPALYLAVLGTTAHIATGVTTRAPTGSSHHPYHLRKIGSQVIIVIQNWQGLDSLAEAKGSLCLFIRRNVTSMPTSQG